MKSLQHLLIPALLPFTVLLAGAEVVRAGDGREIRVEPGNGTITAAAAGAQAGDVLVLAEGRFEDSVRLPAGVELRGAGADKTTLTATGFAAIECAGDNVVRGIEIRGGEDTVRGVNTTMPVRVEQCRFVELREAVALMTAPLSDVVHCEFIDCGIGVRAIGEASPTVWGCLFSGGRMGVFSMGGSPYIRNNVFRGQNEGVRMVTRGSAMPIVRNNVFIECESSGIMLMEQGAVFKPSVRNNFFEKCGSAIVAPGSGFDATSHNAIRSTSGLAWRDEDGNAIEQPDEARIISVDDSITLDEDFALRDESGERALTDAGLRLGSDPDDAAAPIGLTFETGPAGVAVKEDAQLPAVRFRGPVHIANATSEQYQFMQARGLRPSRQSLVMEDGRPFDVHDVQQGGRTVQLKFDIWRYFGERSLGRK